MIYLYLAFVVLPILVWFIYFFSKDRCDPGPKRMMLSIFVIGIGIAFFAAGLETIFDRLVIAGSYEAFSNYLQGGQVTIPLLFSLFNAAIVEETLKYAALKSYFYEKVQFNQIADGIFYGATLALGFSFIENTSYFLGLSAVLTTDQFFTTIFSRAIFTVWLHVTTGALLGYFLGKRKFAGEGEKKYLLSLGWVIVLHAFFNAYGPYLSLILLVPTFIFIIIQFRKPEVTKVWKLTEPKPS